MKRGKSKLITANTRLNARRDPGTGKTLIARAVAGEANAMCTGLPLQLAFGDCMYRCGLRGQRMAKYSAWSALRFGNTAFWRAV
jgi:hypothetical protein